MFFKKGDKVVCIDDKCVFNVQIIGNSEFIHCSCKTKYVCHLVLVKPYFSESRNIIFFLDGLYFCICIYM